MSKAFTKESDGEDDDERDLAADAGMPDGFTNYITPAGHKRLNDELDPPVEGRPAEARRDDRVGGQQRRSLGERRLHLRQAQAARDRPPHPLPVQAARQRGGGGQCRQDHDRVYFGATVTVADESGAERTVSIVGVDELDPGRGRVSWISPIATALLKASVGDVVVLRTPRGTEELEIVAIRYEALP